MMDTIAAIATPHGKGGISVIRISGKDAIDITSKIFKSKTPITEAKSHTIHFGKVVDFAGNVLDECLVSVFREPHSFTGENVCEISCHGGVLNTNKILEELIKNGARLALPGEFTKRAFVNGKIDLAQAEAIGDIIDSQSDALLNKAVNQLGGILSEKINQVRSRIINLLAQIQVEADYPDEDIELWEREDFVNEAKSIYEEVAKLLESTKSGRLVREGVRCAIVGRPNVGKSSLLNALLKEDRAIVTNIPGTTRDVVEDFIQLEGIIIRLADTAGIRDASDEVERLGVKKSEEYIKNSDMCLFVTDISSPLCDEEKEILKRIEDKKYIVVLNKADLENVQKEEDYNAPAVRVSAKEGIGIPELEREMVKLLSLDEISKDREIITNIRHKEAVIRAKEALSRAFGTISAGMPADLLFIDLTEAAEALGEITGLTVNEEVINDIFSRFCLGK